MLFSLSYRTLDECCFKKDVGCDCLPTDAEPCWGQVEMEIIPGGENGDYPIHLCQGHLDQYNSGKYRKENANA